MRKLYNNNMNTRDMLALQVAIGNTKDGWPIGKECKDMAQATMDNYSPEESNLMECGNCHIILSDDNFDDGCPNCGNKGKFLYIEEETKKSTQGDSHG